MTCSGAFKICELISELLLPFVDHNSLTLTSAPAGEAVNPTNLSLYERMTGVGKEYNKQLDREDLYDDQFSQAQQAGKVVEA